MQMLNVIFYVMNLIKLQDFLVHFTWRGVHKTDMTHVMNMKFFYAC